ncbi:MAG: 1-acyl-sn-glycerol-3-phosphate acyltransferase [Acidobacteriota bacterium]|jgi:1-acyl-sn-glycerol-3-phosphate acyltransferase|nr:1-acyl-sn-glycerol-3-phosphate acyltransferase [Acidobacteriota bacterium]
MSQPEPKTASSSLRAPETAQTVDAVEPTPEELSVLTPMERFAFRVTRRMNEGRWKTFWTLCQRTLGMSWIRVCTYNLMNVYGLEHVEAVSRERPILLVANHRTFFDMYVVSAELFRRTKWEKKLFFPVRGRFFYESPIGMFVNLLMGWWSMYPPFFAAGSNPIPEKREFDKYSMRSLVDLCRRGRGHVIGFHPEGTRNRSPDPYSFLSPKLGIGKIIREADPQVVPVFVAGLTNDLPRQIIGNWSGGDPIRVHFGAALDLSRFRDRDGMRTYKEIAEFVMSKIAELGERDRAIYGKNSLESGV